MRGLSMSYRPGGWLVGAAAVAGGAAGRGRTGAPSPAAPNPGYPRAYTAETSLNGTASTQVAAGQGGGADTRIAFRPTSAMFVKVTQTGGGEMN